MRRMPMVLMTHHKVVISYTSILITSLLMRMMSMVKQMIMTHQKVVISYTLILITSLLMTMMSMVKQTIMTHQKVVISYTSLLTSLPRRQDKLACLWFFTCSCPRSLHNAHMRKNMKKYEEKYEEK